MGGSFKAVSDTRRFHTEMTLEGREKGYRLLTNQLYFKYRQVMQERKDRLVEMVEDFKWDYPNLVDADRLRLGNMFDPDDYPDIAKLDGKFGFELTIQPVPRGTDLKVIGLLDHDLQKLRDDIDKNLEERLQVAMKDAWTRLYNGIKRLTGKKIHAAETIQHLCDLVEILPMLNVANDPKLTSLAKEVSSSLCVQNPDQIKHDEKLKKDIVHNAKELLKEVEGAMQGIFG